MATQIYKLETIHQALSLKFVYFYVYMSHLIFLHVKKLNIPLLNRKSYRPTSESLWVSTKEATKGNLFSATLGHAIESDTQLW